MHENKVIFDVRNRLGYQLVPTWCSLDGLYVWAKHIIGSCSCVDAEVCIITGNYLRREPGC